MRVKSRVALAMVLVVLAVFVAGYSVAGSIPQSFAGAGSTRYAMKSRGPLDTTTTQSTTFVDISGLKMAIVIPGGKRADLIIDFSGEVNSCDAMYVRAAVDGAAASPEYTQLQYRLGQNLGADSHSFTFFAKSVGSGTHTVAMQWHGLSACDHQFMAARSMVITANIR